MDVYPSLQKISGDSSDSVLSSFDIFSTPHSHTSVFGGEWTDHPPVSHSENGMIEFYLPGSENFYIDLSNCFINLEVKVKKENGDALPAANAGPLFLPGDNFAHSLFETVSLSLCETDVEYEPNYAYRSYIENLLQYDLETKKSILSVVSGWQEDGVTSKNYDNANGADRTERKGLIAESKPLSFALKLNLSMFNQDRYLLPRIPLRLKLTRTSPKFCLMAEDAAPVGGAKVVITKSFFHVRKIQANVAVQKSHTTLMANDGERGKYPFNRVKTSFKMLNAGVQSAEFNISENGQKPNKVIIGLVSHAQKNGTYPTNPFNFAHHKLSSIELLIDGSPVSKRYEPNYTEGTFSIPFITSMINGGLGVAKNNGLTPSKYIAGSALYIFNTTGDLVEDGGSHLLQRCSLSLKITFTEVTAENISVFILQEKDEIVTISSDYQIDSVSGVL